MSDATENVEKIPSDANHRPDSSYWPIIQALGFALIMAGLAVNVSLVIFGVIVTLTAVVGWNLEPFEM